MERRLNRALVVSAIANLSVAIASVNRRSSIDKVSVDASAELDRTTRKGTRILPTKVKYKSASKIYKNNKGKDKQSVIGKGKTQEAC